MENKKRDDTATLTAKANNVSSAYVRMVVNGTRRNLTAKAISVLAKYNEILQAKAALSQPAEHAEVN